MEVAPERSPIVLALDTPHAATAVAWAQAAGSAVGVVKVGLELFSAAGPDVVRLLRDQNDQVMLDLKLHDIATTVAHAVAALAPLGAQLLTVHAAGGTDMLTQAARVAEGTGMTLAAVTVLTSLSSADLAALGVDGASRDDDGQGGATAAVGPLERVVLRLAEQAVAAGCGALVCAPSEVALVRAAVGPDIVIICPGIRPRWASGDDQVRRAEPAAALAAGASLLVVGRPITRAHDIRAAAERVHAELSFDSPTDQAVRLPIHEEPKASTSPPAEQLADPMSKPLPSQEIVS